MRYLVTVIALTNNMKIVKPRSDTSRYASLVISDNPIVTRMAIAGKAAKKCRACTPSAPGPRTITTEKKQITNNAIAMPMQRMSIELRLRSTTTARRTPIAASILIAAKMMFQPKDILYTAHPEENQKLTKAIRKNRKYTSGETKNTGAGLETRSDRS